MSTLECTLASVPFLLPFAQCFIGVVFAAAVIGKLSSRSSYRKFVESLRVMRLLPERLTGVVAAAVVAAEIFVTLALVPVGVPVVTMAGFALAAVLLSAFAVAVAVVLRRGISTQCRCFGSASSTPLGREHVVRNVFLAVVAVAGAISSMAGAAIEAQNLVLSVPLGLLGALMVVRMDDLMILLRPAR